MDVVDNFNKNLLCSRSIGTGNMEIPHRHLSWFQENGLVNKLRAQIREQMITALKDNVMNSTKTNTTSPKVQAINLLVADFLMNQEDLFTLSVFITEVPLLGNVQEFSSYVNCLGSSTQSIPVTKPRFQFEDTKDILGALGVQPNTNISQLACQYYYNDDKAHSLLACLFKATTTIKNNQSKNVEVQSTKHSSNECTDIEWDNYEHRLNNWLVSVEDILSSFNLNEGQRNSLKKLLKKYHQNNNAQVNAVYKERLKHLEKQNKNMVEKVIEVEQLLATHFHSQDTSLIQKEQIEQVTKNLRLEQKQLYHLIHNFEEKERALQEKMRKSQEEFKTKLQDVEKQKYELQLKEIEILRHKKILEEESLKFGDKTRIIETNKVELLQQQNKELAKQLLEIKSKVDVIEGHKQVQLISSDQIDNNLQKIESSLDREMVRKLQKENDELREFIKIQRQRIEELSNRTLNLAKQMEKNYQISQTTLNHQNNKNVKKKLNFDDGSSKKHSYLSQNISSTTTDHSTTVLESDNQTEEDILQNAHSRMKMLEMKTAKIEQNLKNFQTNKMGHNTDYKVINVDKKSYNKIRSRLSDDSDFSTFRSSSHKINLKELANKIGYHRSMRRSTNNSLSENDTSSEILRNIKYYNKNYTNISPIKVSSFDINDTNNESPANKQNSKINSSIDQINDTELPVSRLQSVQSTQLPIESHPLPTKISSNINNINKESPINRRSPITNSPLDRINDTEISLNTFLITSTQSSKESRSPTVINRLLPETNSSELNNSLNQNLSKTIINYNENIKTGGDTTSPNKSDGENNYNSVLQSSYQTEIIDSPRLQNEGFNKVDSSSSSKTEQKSDHTVSFGSNNTEKSSDFWT